MKVACRNVWSRLIRLCKVGSAAVQDKRARAGDAMSTTHCPEGKLAKTGTSPCKLVDHHIAAFLVLASPLCVSFVCQVTPTKRYGNPLVAVLGLSGLAGTARFAVLVP